MRCLAAAMVLVAAPFLAAAADATETLPIDVLEPTPAAYAWTGFYVGANLGGGFIGSETNFSVTGVGRFASTTNDLSGIAGGAMAGYNYRAGAVVLGAEADFQASGIAGSLVTPCLPGGCGIPVRARFTERIDWYGSVRGRVGYSIDRVLLFAAGGYAYAQVTTEGRASAFGLTARYKKSEWKNGWTIGGGAEAAISPNLFGRIEYSYLDFGSAKGGFRMPSRPKIRYDARLDAQVVRAGVGYRF